MSMILYCLLDKTKVDLVGETRREPRGGLCYALKLKDLCSSRGDSRPTAGREKDESASFAKNSRVAKVSPAPEVTSCAYVLRC